MNSLRRPILLLSALFGALECAAPAPAAADLESLAKPIAGRSSRASSSDAAPDGNLDSRPIAPGATLVLADLAGPGVVVHMWCTVLSQDPFYGRSLVLRIYWDGAAEPSVVAPLGDFFGVGHGAFAEFESVPVGVSSGGRSRDCSWNMPFRQSARITVTNESTQYRTDAFFHYVDWRSDPGIAPDAPYFHALYRQSHPSTPGNYEVLETTGRGHYVGTVFSVHQVESGWFGEGDDFFTVDGEATPSLRGTGTEDYFGDAFGFQKYSGAWRGVTLWEGQLPGDRLTAYRWHVADPIVFQNELRFEIEHKGHVFADSGQRFGSYLERPDWISTVAFWYQHPMRGLAEALPPVAERTAPYRVTSGTSLRARATPPEGLSVDATGIVYRGPHADVLVEVDFDLAEDGWYQVSAFLVQGPAGGRVRATMDGVPFGPELDLFCDLRRTLPIRLDMHELKAGAHVIGFQGLGPSPRRRPISNETLSFGMSHLLLLRVQDMAGYHGALDAATAP